MNILKTMRSIGRKQFAQTLAAFTEAGAKTAEYRAYFTTEDDNAPEGGAPRSGAA